ncbi:DUF192 domain-containing protein [candidate division KSB1 bacterium]|nr:DUF192 domain-containing protein [candidate division KSB1 bacterium]NIR73292.1 DUF192 domain-containing protein [candidate division KSB1 bacterium]NIS26998.1 DUF192 domain-containing protein [candidate division KSB1 bacterium]NIT73838.1 DUF192 domain-containing protein [candidate division KSB1 bacterium]NIU27743.1 DUF192 domain-containing protein [candidate division KSB1 bacterium]
MKYVILILSFIFILSGCERNNQQPQNQTHQTESEEESDNRNLHTITIDGVPLKVEIAQDAETRTHGLMYREDMARDEGMLFVFSEQRILSFWMRNTFIPLDIAFINNKGIIVDIQRMEPLDESKQYISTAPALYALEVNAGWFEDYGIQVGDVVAF